MAICGGDTLRAFEDSLAVSLNPKINARSFTTAADGGEELLEVVIDSKGIASLSRNGVPVKAGPNDTMRYWVTDSKGVRLERYITGDAKGQRAVGSFFSKASKGEVSANEAKALGNKFKAMSAADQANLVGGIENKLRKGSEITEAEFLIAVKGQTGWRTLDGLLSSHLPDLQAAYRSGDVTTALKKVVDSWKNSGSDVTKGRLTRIGTLLKEQFANKPKVIDAPPARIATSSTDVAATTGNRVANTTETGTDVATTGRQVAVNEPLEGVVMPRGTDIVPANPRPGIGVDPIEGTFTRIDDAVELPPPPKQLQAPANTDVVPVNRPRTDVVPASNRGVVLTSEASDVGSDVVVAARRGTEVGEVRPRTGSTGARNPGSRINIDDAQNTYKYRDTYYSSRADQIKAIVRANRGKLTAAFLGGVSAACLLNPKCLDFLDTLGDEVDGSEFVGDLQDNYEFSVKTEDADGAIKCTYKYSKKIAEGEATVEPELQEEMDSLFTKYNLTVKWVPTEKLTADKTSANKLCEDNQNPCIIEKELAQVKDVPLGYVAKLLLGEQEVASDSSCKNNVDTEPNTDTPINEEDPEEDDGDPDWYDEDEEETEDRGPAGFNPDPWNILGGNTGKKYPLIPPQPLIPPSNQQMYVTPGYY